MPSFPGAANQRGTEEIPTVGFCEMVKHAPAYFDKTVRLVARYEMATEGRYLNDANCPLTHDQQIGAGSGVLNPKQQEILNAQLRKIARSEYGGRAVVTVVGVLRNSSLRAFAWYQYRFDIVRVEAISPVTVPYEGELQASVTYLANVSTGDRGSLSLVPALRLREHHATRIVWTNLNDFPKLRHLTDKARVRRILFTVLSDDIREMTATRWNRTIRCKIVHVD